MVWNQYQVFLELLPSILGTAPKKIETGTESNWNSSQKILEQRFLEPVPSTIGNKSSWDRKFIKNNK